MLAAAVGPELAAHDPVAVTSGDRLLPPDGVHPLGTDALGRDILSRILHGTRLTVVVVILVLGIVLLLGVPLGAIAGYRGGWVDEIIMRFGDLVLAFPGLVLAVAIAVVLGPSLSSAAIAVALVRWPRYARVMRAMALTLKHRPFVEAAICAGASSTRVMVRHILPNAVDAIIVRTTVDAGYIVLTVASLSFVGIGAQPPTPEWGAMLADGRAHMLDAWWVATFPGLAILLSVLAFTLVGDELRDRLDPIIGSRRMKQGMTIGSRRMKQGMT